MFSALTDLKVQLSSALRSQREQLGSCIVFYLTDKRMNSEKKSSNYKKHPVSSFFHGINAGIAQSELLWMRVVPGAPRDAASHPSSGSRREIQKMLRIYSGG